MLQVGKIGAAPHALFGANGTEDVGRSGALIAGSTRDGCRVSAQRRVILFFWPIRASSWNNLYGLPTAIRCATIIEGSVEKF